MKSEVYNVLRVNTLAHLGKPRRLGETNIERILNAYLRISLMLFIGLLFCACSPDFNPTRKPSTSSVDLELLIPAKLAQNVARGTVVRIEPRTDRLFVTQRV
jgi:hypothetical protein